MDPNTTLANLREAIEEYWRIDDIRPSEDYNEAAVTILDQLVIAASALDTWMSKGGFSPWNVNSKN